MFETIREFAAQILSDAGTLESLRTRHADYFFGVVHDVYAAGLSLREEFERLGDEQANVQAALVWSEERGEFARLAATVADLWRLWRRSTGQLEVGLRWGEVALAHRDTFDSDLNIRLLGGASELWRFSGDRARAKAMKLECVEIAERTGSRIRVPHGDLAVTHTLADLADMAMGEGNFEEARAHLEKGLALGGGPRLLGSVGYLAFEEDDLDRARHFTEQAVAGFKAAGHDFNYGASLSLLAEIARRSGDRPGAVAHLSDALRVLVKLDDEIGVARTLDDFAVLSAEEGDLDRAGRLFGAATRFGAFADHPSEMEPQTAEALPADAVEAGQMLTLDQAVNYALLAEEAQARVLEATETSSN
jgi:tetratricopeptide (TPR) repeat protein